jgi:uncharacterized protein
MIAVNVAQLLRDPVGSTRSYPLDEREPELAEELGLTSPIVGTLKLTRTNHGILADVRYRVDIEQECGRCLEPAYSTVESEVSEEYLPSLNIVTGQPVEIAADPEEPRVTDNHEVDVTDLVRQDIVLQQPLQPLCRPDCPGLCQQCGAVLSQGDCGCAEAMDDVDVPAPSNNQLSRLGELLKAQLPPN